LPFFQVHLLAVNRQRALNGCSGRFRPHMGSFWPSFADQGKERNAAKEKLPHKRRAKKKQGYLPRDNPVLPGLIAWRPFFRIAWKLCWRAEKIAFFK
jgi:hypothetical protein